MRYERRRTRPLTQSARRTQRGCGGKDRCLGGEGSWLELGSRQGSGADSRGERRATCQILPQIGDSVNKKLISIRTLAEVDEGKGDAGWRVAHQEAAPATGNLAEGHKGNPAKSGLPTLCINQDRKGWATRARLKSHSVGTLTRGLGLVLVLKAACEFPHQGKRLRRLCI